MGKLLISIAALLLTGASAIASVSPGEPVPPERRAVTPAALEPLSAHFGQTQRAYRSSHFVLLYDAEPWQAHSHALLLERTHARFYEVFEQAGFGLQPLREHLVCLLFVDQDDFAHYGEAADYMDLSWTGGYYSARTNRIALFQRGWPGARPAADDVEPTVAIELHEHEKNEPTLRLSSLEPAASDGRQDGLVSTVHEAAHQLAFNSGLQTRGVMYPLWVSEGLAIAFETQRPSQPFGPGQVNAPRHDDLRHAHAAGQVVPLEQFVSLVRPPANGEQLRVVYAQAWALFHHLFTQQPEQMRDYLARLADRRPGWRSARTLQAEFVAAFGPLEQVDADWQTYLDTLNDSE